jgi:SAM-dependent methyltransferase
MADEHRHQHPERPHHDHGHDSAHGPGPGPAPDHGHQHQHGPGTDDAAMAELLDLDAEVLHAYLSEVTGWISELAADPPARRILDLGSGSGTGTFALLRRFEGAEATAVDMSAQLLHHLGDRARALGVADRVRTVEADLDTAWPDLGTFDLVWASASLHHMAEPDRVLTDVLAALRPGGLLAVAEMGASPFPRFLPDDLGLGRPGLEERCHAALAVTHAADVPHLGSDWAARLSRAGFTIEAERRFVIDLKAPLPAATGRYAQASLGRLRAHLDTRLGADDLATLDTLLDSSGPAGLLRRDDLTVRTERTVWAARHP